MVGWFALIWVQSLFVPAHAEDRPIQLETFRTHSRLKIHVDPGVESIWKETPGGFNLIFKGISLADLGAPLGAEQEWAKQFVGDSDSRLAELKFKETQEGLEIHGRWKFPDGKLAPAHPLMERFDFREKSPPTYVLDFWHKAGPTLAEEKAVRQKRDTEIAIKKMDEEAQKRRDRRIAVEKARTELENATPFCDRPMHASRDVFMDFFPVREKFDLGRWFAVVTPDRGYAYHEPQGDAKDAQYVRLALELYKQGKTGLVIRTLDFLESEHPKSIYFAEMRFLRANALIKLGNEDEALRILVDIIKSFGDSPVAIESGIYVAKRSMERNQSLASLEQFLWLINRHSGHRLAWVFHLGAAESLFALKQTERAAKEYAWVMQNAPERQSQAEAAIRLGDLYLVRQQYEQALAGYYQAVLRYKDEVKSFPSININRAETLYKLEQFERAEQEFRSFLAQFPGHPEGWRATLRLGEILARREGEGPQKEARKWLYDTVNQFPFSPGAVLARVRLIPCGDRGGFSAEGAVKYFEEEAKKFDGGGEVSLSHYRDFRGLAEMRLLVSLGKPAEAFDVGMKELQENPRSEARVIIGDNLRALFRRNILNLIEQGKKYEALSFYKERKEGLPRRNPDADPVPGDYLLKLAQAAADLNLGGTAEEIAQNYRQQQNSEQSGRAVAGDDLEAKLKRSAQSFTEARALWVSEGPAAQDRVMGLLEGVAEESEYSYEREVLWGLLEERAKHFSSALKHALKAQMLLPKDGASDVQALERGRIESWVAALQGVAGDARLGIAAYRKLQKTKFTTDQGIRGNATGIIGLANPPSLDKLILAEGELLGHLGRWGDAASAYSRAIEAKLGGNQALYEYARALDRSGRVTDREKSRVAMEDLAESDTDDFWRRLARTKLADETGKYKPKGNSRKPAKEGGK